MKYYLGIDMGSSSIKATVIDEEGRIAAKAKTPTEVLNPREGFFEIDSEKVWWGGFREISRQISTDVPLDGIEAICISSLCGTFVPVDSAHRPVHNAILYSIDTRSRDQVRRLNERFGEAVLTERLGGAFTTHSTIPKVLWLKENLPEVYENAACFVESNNYVSMKLTGRTAWDFPSAIGSQMINLEAQDVDRSLIREIGLDPDKFPQCRYVTDLLGEVCMPEALELGYREGTLVMTGGCDINAEAMSIGAVRPGDMLVVFGSTMSTIATLDAFKVRKGFRTGMSVLKGTYRLGTASHAGGRHIHWIDKMIGQECRIDLSRLPTGILMLPFLDGARSPFDNPNAEPVLIGLKGSTTLNDIAVSAREALGYEVAMLLHMLGEEGVRISTINCTGGLTHDRAFMQIVADITGHPQRLFLNTDASYGGALVSLQSRHSMQELFALPGVAENLTPDETVQPDPERHARYLSLSERFNGLYDKIKDVFE